MSDFTIRLVKVTSVYFFVAAEEKAQREGGRHSQSVQLPPQGESQDSFLSVCWVHPPNFNPSA